MGGKDSHVFHDCTQVCLSHVQLSVYLGPVPYRRVCKYGYWTMDTCAGLLYNVMTGVGSAGPDVLLLQHHILYSTCSIYNTNT